MISVHHQSVHYNLADTKVSMVVFTSFLTLFSALDYHTNVFNQIYQSINTRYPSTVPLSIWEGIRSNIFSFYVFFIFDYKIVIFHKVWTMLNQYFKKFISNIKYVEYPIQKFPAQNWRVDTIILRFKFSKICFLYFCFPFGVLLDLLQLQIYST